MRATDFTVPVDALITLVAECADLHALPADPDALVEAMLDLLAAADDIHAALSTYERRWIAGLAGLGVVVKSCRKCGDRFAANERGRPRAYCSDECARRARA